MYSQHLTTKSRSGSLALLSVTELSLFGSFRVLFFHLSRGVVLKKRGAGEGGGKRLCHPAVGEGQMGAAVTASSARRQARSEQR